MTQSVGATADRFAIPGVTQVNNDILVGSYDATLGGETDA